MITNYTVSGMTCGNCVHHVTEEVSDVEGVNNVSVTLEGGAMSVESDERIPFDAIIEAVREAGGYTVVEA
ncbi:heavy-metal-associated domain-containing protein [Tessaracoccus sp. MC1865]|uniref:heavy-metal-associated domain-containing protein n=1 Tax=unclassified Tessaracoccus TaxID=2635419 RepID=UPI001600E2A0|nr:heavy metal-associated domain-containing protein [Tessaracoccus sp. MC1865]MBB1483264.1 heavy-metal-associated domain-containing protein [Tessaracoccus sp. MC1865]MBB1510304.1 heavy-metal-associated domain-containing protein [Tessaracoccus sp. MC1756]QTO37325.1 heavy-metal-associated domain-containing protein [Tessaracoccus sp. MC1865]